MGNPEHEPGQPAPVPAREVILNQEGEVFKETSMTKQKSETAQETKTWAETMHIIGEHIKFAKEHLPEIMKILSRYEEIQTAETAVLRLAVLLIINLGDKVPIFGQIGSIGADFGKIYADFVYERMQKEAVAKGLDPKKIERPKYNFTPDVSKKFAIGLDWALRFVSINFLSTQMIETGLQFRADLPRILEGLKKMKEVIEEYNRNKMTPQYEEMYKKFKHAD